MKKIWAWLRTLDAGDWIALLVALGSSAFAVALVAANTWSAVVGSLQPEMIKFKGTDYDLIAQRSMSAAAWWMVACTIVSVLVSTLAVVLVSLNLREARLVTKEAKRSADMAERSVSASRDGVAATMEAGKAQMRAYLMVANAVLSKDGSHQCNLLVDFKNAGQTPALRVGMRVLIWTDDAEAETLILEEWEPTFDLAPGAEDTLTFSSERLAQKLHHLNWGERLNVSLKIEIQYEDVFQDHQLAEASFWGRGQSSMSGVQLFREMEEYKLL